MAALLLNQVPKLQRIDVAGIRTKTLPRSRLGGGEVTARERVAAAGDEGVGSGSHARYGARFAAGCLGPRRTAAAALTVLLACTAPLAVAVTPALIPAPAHLEVQGEGLTLRDGLEIRVGAGREVAAIGRYLAALIRASRGIALALRSGAVAPGAGAIDLRLDADAPAGEESYRLEIAPAGARVTAHDPHGLFYGADLITRRIANAQTLAECLAAGRLDSELAEETGALVARFHRAGIWHADLNAHNVLVTSDELYL
ncbi:MAG: glycoside hydrolase family 20 zincin-like fold domain-containing protein, partial [Steroidobacterales bacterium]